MDQLPNSYLKNVKKYKLLSRLKTYDLQDEALVDESLL